MSMGVDSRKVLVGVAMYGRSYTLKDPGQVRIGEAVVGPGRPGRYTQQSGLLSLLEVKQILYFLIFKFI
jgi:chitinase